MSENPTCMAVIGMGYVGLPLAAAFAAAGYRVIGLDISEEKCAKIMSGRTVTPDVPDAEVKQIVDAGLLEASADFSRVAEADLISICVPTPLGKHKDPDISYIVTACDSIVPHVKKGCTVVLESTTYPGTTREVILAKFEEAGFTVGEDFFLAFSPERVDPGNETWHIRNTPKVVGGITETCTEKACAFYRAAIEKVVPMRSAEHAEMVKLLENTFRSINIGLVNELALVCNRLDLNVWDIIEAAATKPFGFMPFRPGPGLGGHCIPIDPLYLSWKMKTLDYKVRFIDLADEVNSGMPLYVVQRVGAILNQERKAINGSKILLLGIAYKKDVDDVRESPALDVFEELRQLGADVEFHDPFVPSFRFVEETIEGTTREDALQRDYDLMIVTTDHSDVDYGAFLERKIPVLDTRNALRGSDAAHVHGL
jgi:UDP-N-acetyl-D-glucosamine dehydrogenase